MARRRFVLYVYFGHEDVVGVLFPVVNVEVGVAGKMVDPGHSSLDFATRCCHEHIAKTLVENVAAAASSDPYKV